MVILKCKYPKWNVHPKTGTHTWKLNTKSLILDADCQHLWVVKMFITLEICVSGENRLEQKSFLPGIVPSLFRIPRSMFEAIRQAIAERLVMTSVDVGRLLCGRRNRGAPAAPLIIWGVTTVLSSLAEKMDRKNWDTLHKNNNWTPNCCKVDLSLVTPTCTCD